jgi:hypothetical protein
VGTRRLIAAGLVVVACAMVGGSALAAEAGGGRHFPHFSLLGERVAVKDLPPELRLLVVGPPGSERFGIPHMSHGPIWFGEVDRPGATLAAAAKGHWICQFELPKGGTGGGSVCTQVLAAREFGLLDITSCGKGRPTHFRIHALLPDGVTAVEVENDDGTVGRTVPVVDNTVAFGVGREDIVLRAVGDAVAEGLERTLPLAHAGGIGNRAGCAFYTFAEAKKGPS